MGIGGRGTWFPRQMLTENYRYTLTRIIYKWKTILPGKANATMDVEVTYE